MSSLGGLLYLILFTTSQFAADGSNFTATFFFGDSTLDTGNNQFVSTPFRCNHHPYGLDFPNQTATGRFSNGLLVPDLLTAALGIKEFSPPYLDPVLSDEDIQTGVNFASAGSGYDDLTSMLANTVSMTMQLQLFGEYLERLERVVGKEEKERIVGGALVMFSAGGNDMIFNFYDLNRRRKDFSLSSYQDFLHGILKVAVKSVYSHGVRKFIVGSLPPIGCLPMQITANLKHTLHRRCVDSQIADTLAYNAKLSRLLPELQRSLPGSKIAYLDITDNFLEIINNPRKYGYEEAKRGCCGTGLIEVGPLCNTMCGVCKNVSSFVFFDSIHPSERIYRYVTDYTVKNIIPQLY